MRPIKCYPQDDHGANQVRTFRRDGAGIEVVLQSQALNGVHHGSGEVVKILKRLAIEVVLKFLLMVVA